jgi:Pilus formation protein N terminal region
MKREASWPAFAVHSPIVTRIAASGAGSAAYRFSRLVNVPGSSMSFWFLRRPFRSFAFAIGLLLWPAAVSAEPADAIAVSVDQAKLVKLPTRVATIVVGNPLIADVTLQNGGIVVVTGKGYGATNFIAMDRTGEVLVDRLIQVEGPTDQLVTVYRGVERETYSCMPVCQRRVTLGDGDNYFKSVMDQAGTLSNQAAGSASSASNKGSGAAVN